MRAPERLFRAGLAALALGAGTLAAQAAAPAPAAPAAVPAIPEAEIYRREVFRYQPRGRLDPFQPLVGGEEMGVRVQDLKLVGIIYSSAPRQSVAVFTLPDSAQRVRLRVGQRLGTVTVLSISPRRVELREDEMGVSRVYTLEVPRPGRPAGSAAPVSAPPPAAARPR